MALLGGYLDGGRHGTTALGTTVDGGGGDGRNVTTNTARRRCMGVSRFNKKWVANGI